MLVFVAAILVSLFTLSDYSISQVALTRLVNIFVPLSQARLFFNYADNLLQLASLVISVWLFYMIGKRVELRNRPLSFAAIVLVGTLIGNTIDYIIYAPLYGQGWETSFGDVVAWGTGDLTSFLTILTLAVASFMVPVAGLALSSLRQDSLEGFQTSGAPERPSYRSFLVSAFVIAALASPISSEVYKVLGYLSSQTGSITVESLDPWQGLISGYVGFLVYPVLLIVAFYFFGQGRTMSWKDLARFGLRTFVAGAGGLLVGLVLSVGIESGWGAIGSYLLSNLLSHIVFLVFGGLLILVVGFGSASLGMLKGGESGRGISIAQGRRKFLPLLLSVLLVTIVATAAVASYAFVLDPALSASNYSCTYEPGQAFYLRIVADQSQTPLDNQPIKAQLMSACPIFTVCTDQSGQPPCSMGTQVIRNLGSWDFVTNSSGYISVPRQYLGGSDLWFSLTYVGHDYQTKYQICGGGVTYSQLSLPSGAYSAQEVPLGNSGVGSGTMSNGTQFSTGCNPVSFSGNATIS
jgi:hypothetical protein